MTSYDLRRTRIHMMCCVHCSRVLEIDPPNDVSIHFENMWKHRNTRHPKADFDYLAPWKTTWRNKRFVFRIISDYKITS